MREYESIEEYDGLIEWQYQSIPNEVKQKYREVKIQHIKDLFEELSKELEILFKSL